jgi:hypothetical protein
MIKPPPKNRAEIQNKDRFEIEIAKRVSEWDKDGKDLVPSFITAAIVQSHEQDGLVRENDHTLFFLHYTYKAVRQDVGAYILKHFSIDSKKPEQVEITLHGFEYVQRRYIVKRDGQDIAIAPNLLTEKERAALLQRLRKSGKSILAHADEVERYFAMLDEAEKKERKLSSRRS